MKPEKRKLFDEMWSNPKKRAGLLSRFWARVDKTPGHGPKGDCWKWTGVQATERAKHDRGYGLTSFNLRGKQYHIYAHIFAYEIHKGRPPEDKPLTCHSCDYPPCVNPDHLFASTFFGNVYDMIVKGRARRKSKRQEPKQPATSVGTMRLVPNKEQAGQIKDARQAKGVTQAATADLLDLDVTHYCCMENGRGRGCTPEQMNCLLQYLGIHITFSQDQYFRWQASGRRVIGATPRGTGQRPKALPRASRYKRGFWLTLPPPCLDYYRADIIRFYLRKMNRPHHKMCEAAHLGERSLKSVIAGHPVRQDVLERVAQFISVSIENLLVTKESQAEAA